MANGSPFINTQAGAIIMQGAQLILNATATAQQLKLQRDELDARVRDNDQRLKAREERLAIQDEMLELRKQKMELDIQAKQAALDLGLSPSGQQTMRNLLISQIDERVRAVTVPGIDVAHRDVGDIDSMIADLERQSAQIEAAAPFLFEKKNAHMAKPPRYLEIQKQRDLLRIAKDLKFKERERLIGSYPPELQTLIRSPQVQDNTEPAPTAPGREPTGGTARTSRTRTQRQQEFAQLLQAQSGADRQKTKDAVVDTLVAASKESADPAEQDARITEMYDQMIQFLEPALITEIIQAVSRQRAEQQP